MPAGGASHIWRVAPQIAVEVVAGAEVQALCATHAFGPAQQANAQVRFEAESVAIRLPEVGFAFSHPELRWPRDGAAFVEAVLHAAALEVAWRAGGLLIHGAGLWAESGALLALADSGGGKSTLTTLAQGRYRSLSDETLHLRPGAPPELSATSFRSDAPVAPICAAAPLRAIALLEKSADPATERVQPSAAASAVLAQLYRPHEATSAELLRRTSALLRGVAVLRFRFPKSPAAVDLLDRVLRGG